MPKAVRSSEAPDAATASTDEILLLALLNTTPVVEGVQADEWADDARMHEWLARHVPDAPKHTDLSRLRATREALQRVIRAEADPEVLNDVLGEVRLRPTAGHGGVGWVYDMPPETAVAANAVLAWGRILADSPGRLRPCSNSECSLFFVDHSRANTGRWCSMAVCGNRMKARRHYARAK